MKRQRIPWQSKRARSCPTPAARIRLHPRCRAAASPWWHGRIARRTPSQRDESPTLPLSQLKTLDGIMRGAGLLCAARTSSWTFRWVSIVKSRESRMLAISTAAGLCRADTSVSGRFCVNRCGRSHRVRRTDGSENFQSSVKKGFFQHNRPKEDIRGLGNLPTEGLSRPADATMQPDKLKLSSHCHFSFLMLSIVEIDLHRDELRALGLVGELRIDSALMAP
jgi:hypothetical protein